MTYDVFISYARKDDVDARVSTFVDALSRFHKVITGDDLRVFFDRDEIRSGDDWYLRLLESLRHSASMVALLSPAYLESEYCWIEWTTFERQAAVAMAVDQGIKPLVVVPQPGLEIALDTVNPTWLVGRTPWRSLLDPLQRGTVDLTAGRDIDDLLNRLTEESIRRRLADLTGSIEIEDTFTGELVESVRWIRRLRLRRDKAKASAAHRMPTLRPGFVGRVPELRAMRRALAEGTEVAVSAEGVGGIGKTEIAIAYAHAFAWDYPGGRWFIPAEGQIKLAPLLANAMAEGLGVILTPEQLADSDGGFRYIVSRLHTLPDDARKVLVVLDNVDQDALVSAEAVRSLGVDAEWFDLIITSRKRLRGGSSDGTLRMVRIDVLPERELLILLGLSPDATETERTAAASLLERTGRLTLAVEIAGAYCRRNSVSLSDYVADLEDVLKGLSDSLNAGAATEINHSGKYVDHLFRRSIESLSPPAKMILGYACRMHPDHIVIPWLSELCCREDSTLAKRKLGKTGFEQAFLELQNASLMEAPDATGRICRMHRLLGDTVRGIAEMDTASMSDAVCPKCGSDGTDCAEYSPSRDSRLCKLVDCVLMLDWFDVELRWQLEPVRAWLCTRPDDMYTVRLCKCAGEKSRLLGHYLVGDKLLSRSFQFTNAYLGEEDPETLACLFSLAECHYAQGLTDSAEQLFRHTYEMRTKLFGHQHGDTLASLNNLALMTKAKGDVNGAEELFRKIIQLKSGSLGPEHQSTATSLSNLANVLQAKGDFTGSEDITRTVHRIRERTLGSEHPDTLTSLSNLAEVLKGMCAYDEALQVSSRALEAMKRVLGEDHPNTLICLNNLGTIYMRIGLAKEAELLFQQAYKGKVLVFGPDHPSTLKTLIHVADGIREKGDLAGAEPLYRRALETRERILGPEHTDTKKTADALNRLLETRRIVEQIKGCMDCERCLGTGFVAHSDIVRLGMQSEWTPGPCMLCREAAGKDGKS